MKVFCSERYKVDPLKQYKSLSWQHQRFFSGEETQTERLVKCGSMEFGAKFERAGMAPKSVHSMKRESAVKRL